MTLYHRFTAEFRGRNTAHFDYLQEVFDLCYLASVGLECAAERPEDVYDVKRSTQPDPEREKSRLLDRLRCEVGSNFPGVNGHAAILLWGSFELFLRDFLATWLRVVEDARRRQGVPSIKYSVVDLLELDEHTRWLCVVDSLERESKRDTGGPAFKKVLKKFLLYPQVSPEIEGALVELEHVRHALVHRRGRATRNLLRHCPNLGGSEGQTVRVTLDMVVRYHSGITDFWMALIKKVEELLRDDAPYGRQPGSSGTQIPPLRGTEGGHPPAEP